MNLRRRCADFIVMQHQRAITRTGSPVDDLVGFVLSERGRTADATLEETLPLVLYFASEADRQEMVDAINAAKPMISVSPTASAGKRASRDHCAHPRWCLALENCTSSQRLCGDRQQCAAREEPL